MFQYAAGRALALRTGSDLVLDLRDFDRRPSMSYALSHFNIQAASETGHLPPLRKAQRLRHLLWRYVTRSPRLIEEKGLAFDSRLIRQKPNVYLDGYWQSERYFSDFSDVIRNDFTIKTQPSIENLRKLEDISSCVAISIHIRRGDYLQPENFAILGTCSLEYYARGVNLIAAKIAQTPVIYAFSDDPDWVRDTLALPFETRIMSHNGPHEAFEDLRLMSACRHHVIANSSFSWWGAWLNPSPDKIVVAPKRWFVAPSLHNPDITPDSWHRLED